jgi:U3 small nucleolar RNA-associated protein 12
MQVAFEPEVDWTKGDRGHSHYFWTASKDKLLKYLGGDKVSCLLLGSNRALCKGLTGTPHQFENIQKLNGHHGEIWAMVVSNSGKFVVTGSHDKSIRV